MSLQCKIEDQESSTEPSIGPPNEENVTEPLKKQGATEEDAKQSDSGTGSGEIARPGDRGGQRVV